MTKVLLILLFGWLLIRCVKLINKIKITSNKKKNETINKAKINADIQEGEFEDME